MTESEARHISSVDASALWELQWFADEVKKHGDWTLVGHQVERTSRWMNHMFMVLLHIDGSLWGLPYQVGLTELQEDALPWREEWMQSPRGSGNLLLRQMFIHPVTTVEYRDYPYKATE